MKFRAALFALSILVCAGAATASPVLMISLDGLRPADVLEAKKRGLNLPHLTAFLKDGAYATGVRPVLPSVTYPDHTTLITGVWPAIHGIANNEVFDPYDKNLQGWYWYESDIRVQTLWDVVHDKHGVVDSVGWPVSVGATSIDYNVPEYWRAQTADDLKLIRALSTPGLIARLEKDSGLPLGALFGQDPQNDVGRTRYAEKLIDFTFPEFMTVHLVSLDHYQHVYGPDSPQAKSALEGLDSDVGELIAEARRVQPNVIIAVVSDHGFAPVRYQVNLGKAFVEDGLVTLDAQRRRVTAWDAIPWNADGSSAIVLARPDDPALKDKVATLLSTLAADPASGVGRVIDKAGIEARGGTGKASFWVDFKPGYYAGPNYTGPLVTPSTLKGTHGYFPDDKEMHATFLIEGPGIKAKKLGEIDMRDIAPTLAKIMGVSLSTATGKPLF
jgi:predicted AlkP superfamily pyrophosphatase or phosphodiesterase